MFLRLFEILKEKGLVTTAEICKSYISGELYRYYLDHRENVSIHSSAEIHPSSKFGDNGSIMISSDCRIRRNAVISPSGGRIEIGENSLVNSFSMLIGSGSIQIGADTLIGPHTVITAANHTFSDSHTPIVRQEISKEGIEIHDDVWISANCTILDGVTLGEGCVVAAGSVVTESVPEYAVVAGTPAKQVKTRN